MGVKASQITDNLTILMQTTNKPAYPRITDRFWWESTSYQWFSFQRTNNTESVFLWWRHHMLWGWDSIQRSLLHSVAAGVLCTIWYVQSLQHTWWRHQMETFSTLLAICAGNSPVTGEFPAQRPVTRSFDASFDHAWINGWVNNREAGDLRRHRSHCDVTIRNLSQIYMYSVFIYIANIL